MGEEANPLRVSVDVRAEYTDNRDSSAVAEDNVDLWVGPRVELKQRGERADLDFRYAPSYRYRMDPADSQNEGELQQEAALNLKYRPTPRIALGLADTFHQTDDPAVVEDGGTLRRDSSFILNRTEAEATYECSRRTDAAIRGIYSVKRYEDDQVRLESDEESGTAELTLRHQVVRNVSALAFGSGSLYDYESDRGIERGCVAVSGGFGLVRMLARGLKGSVRGGWTSVSYQDASLGDTEAPYVSAVLQGEPDDQVTLSVEAAYRARGSDVFPFTSQKELKCLAKAEWEMSPRIALALSGTYRLGEYDSESAASAATDADYVAAREGDITTVTAVAQAVYKITDRTSVKLVQTFEDVDSDVSVSYRRNASSLTLSQQF
jgi:hypothetical protein